MTVKPIPDGHHTVTPYLTVQGASRLIEFMRKAFDGNVTERMMRPDGSIGHAEVRIGDSVVMVPSAIYLYVKDADATCRRALQAGSISVMEPANQFWGDRQGGVRDPVGNYWWIATHIEDVSPEEMAKRTDTFMKQQSRG